MSNFFNKVFEAIKHLLTRPGMKTFLKEHLEQAIVTVEKLIEAKGGLGAVTFHDLRDDIFAALKAMTGTDKDNWVAGLAFFAVEAIRASQKQ